MAETQPGNRAAHPQLTIRRVFDAPPWMVWEEWTDPAFFADWFGGAETEVPLSTVSIDLRPGGMWRATTLAYGPDRRDIQWQGEYLEVLPPERLAFTISGYYDGPPDIVEMILTELGDGRTAMLFQQFGLRTPEEYEVAGKTWRNEFDRIADRVLDIRSRTSEAS